MDAAARIILEEEELALDSGSCRSAVLGRVSLHAIVLLKKVNVPFFSLFQKTIKCFFVLLDGLTQG